MWIQCIVDKVLDLREGTSRNNEPYKFHDIDLDFLDYDDQGKPVVNAQGQYVHSKVRVSAFGELADFIDQNNVQAGQQIWAELHFYTELVEDRTGNSRKYNKISLRSLRRV